MLRVADCIIEKLYEKGAKHMFFVPGSGCMYLIDALAKKEDVTAVNMHHEQSAGMAALAYAQATKKIGVCVVTTGCGGTNAITALLHAWQDGIPCVFLSGQAERNHTIRNSEVKLRQFGRQEADIISIVSSICKYAVMINDTDDVAYEVEKAIYEATSGRKGPVWIDIPLDIQNAMIEPIEMRHCDETSSELKVTNEDLYKIKSAIKRSQRPIILAGNGIHWSGAEKELAKFVEKSNIPMVHSRLGCDLLPSDYDLSVGMVGMLGASRAGNFAIQNADFVFCIGCRLSINTTGYDYEAFAREAKLYVVDIDEEEHNKNTVKIDRFIHADAKNVLERLNCEEISFENLEWIEKCKHWKKTLPILMDDYKSRDKIDMYDLAEILSHFVPENAIILSDAGDGYYIGTSGFKYKQGQMAISSGAQAEMGFALPGAIGAYFATGKPVVVFVGDGSLMMNLQELATVARYEIPLKLIVINNNGYSCIRKLHQGTFKRYVGCDPEGGLGMPDFSRIARGFGLSYSRIANRKELFDALPDVLNSIEPEFCEVLCTEEQQFLAVSVGRNSKRRFVTMPLENQAPFMPREILEQEMIVPIKE